MTGLQIAWFLLVGVLLTVYAILDGFDLGVGIWHSFTRTDAERRLFLRAVGPVWDGNEVWLITGGGAVFAAFPPVYATVFSGLYVPIMLLLCAMILRAVSFEFRNKEDSTTWRKGWDLAFAFGSIVPALAFPVVVGNLLVGLPLDAEGHVTGNPFTLLNPYAVAVGATGFSMFAMQGAIYLMNKTEGDLAERARGWAFLSGVVCVSLFVLLSIWTIAVHPRLTANFHASPILWAVPALTLACFVLALLSVLANVPPRAFLFSSLAIAGLMGIVGASLFPNLVPALDAPDLSLTIHNASSSRLTLTAMLILALVGMPVVVAYTIWVYRKFAGKVRLEGDGY
jgi:cytochrome d ubiquinol oxidase subunit II